MTLTPTLIDAIRAQLTAPARTWQTPGELARALDPRTKQTPALTLIDDALIQLANTPDGRLIISLPPQEGKSTRAMDFIIWSLLRNPDLRVAVASYAQGLANRNGRRLRNTIAAHPHLGLSIAPDNGAISEWTLAGHDGGVLSVGRGAGITGRPVDLLLIDDPLKDRNEADSQLIRDNCWDWWTDSLSTRLAPGAPVLLILTRWHEDDLAGRLTSAPDGHLWQVINIPAEADTDDDPLGRKPGTYLDSARGRTEAQWDAIKVRVGSRTWASLYQGRPAPAEGGMVKRDWWQYYDQPLWIELDNGQRRTLGMDAVLISADLTFKGEDHSDYVAIGVWGRRGPNAYLLDQVRGHYDFPEQVRQLEALCARWPDAALKVIEDKANGPAVIATLRRRIPGIVAEIPQGSKVARLAAVSPLIEAGNVHLPNPQLAPWVGDYVEEFAGFPNAAHDDQVDHTTQGLNRLLLQPLLTADADEWTQLAPEHSIINY